MPQRRKTNNKRSRAKKPAKKTARHHIYDFFIPHHGNNHAPHILHPKRAVLYGAVATGIKVAVVMTTALMPLEAFLAPDVLSEQQHKLLALVNEVRAEQELPALPETPPLKTSSQLKVDDMATNHYFDHNGPNGHNFKYFLKTAGYDYHLAGENLAMGFSDARAVVNAWVKSPLHYRNIIEPDFKEMGMSLAVGTQDAKDTIYIANHFGDPVVTPAARNEAATPASNEVQGAVTKREEVPEQSEPAAVAAQATPESPDHNPSFRYDASQSNVYWEYEHGATTLTVQAHIEGAVDSALATVDEYSIPLQPDPTQTNVYTGTMTVQKPINDFFEVILAPTIEITGTHGATLVDMIPWYKIKVTDQTPLRRYEHTKSWSPAFAQALFTTERGLYLFILTFFIIALGINILIEVRTQRPHVILPTVALIALVTVLWLV